MNRYLILIALFSISLSVSSVAQQPARALTTDDYARAEKMLSYNTDPLVDRNGVRATWLPDGRFYYRVMTASGSEFVVINPADGSRKAAGSLAELGITGSGGATGRVGRRSNGGDPAVSPDGTKSAFIREFNLWVKDNATGKETQLTTDGVKNFGYATDNAGWTHSDRAVVAWSRMTSSMLEVGIVTCQPSLRVRGSSSRYATSASRFASSTAIVMIRKMPCISG